MLWETKENVSIWITWSTRKVSAEQNVWSINLPGLFLNVTNFSCIWSLTTEKLRQLIELPCEKVQKKNPIEYSMWSCRYVLNSPRKADACGRNLPLPLVKAKRAQEKSTFSSSCKCSSSLFVPQSSRSGFGSVHTLSTALNLTKAKNMPDGLRATSCPTAA